MDRLSTTNLETERAVRVRRLVEEYGLPEAEAQFAVDLADGTTKGDIVGLTDEERRRMGLDRPIVDLRPAATTSESRRQPADRP